jgi:hypothetical protein
MIPTTPFKDETMLKEGAAKLAARHEAQRSAVAKVVPISERVKSCPQALRAHAASNGEELRSQRVGGGGLGRS